MDIKCEEEFKVELLEISEEDDKINIHLEQCSALEQIEDKNYYGLIDMKGEIEVKDPLAIEEEEAANDKLEEDDGTIDMKSEIEVKEESFVAEEETKTNEELPDKICGFNQNQSLISTKTEGEEDSKRKSTSRNVSNKAVLLQQYIKKNYAQSLKCGYCKFICKSKNELKTHLKNQKCDVKRHMITHADVQLSKCSHCSYESNLKGNMKKHMLKHTNVKLFKCSECSYESNHKSNLQTHMLQHTNVKLFKCSQCSYECNQKGNLKAHMITHVPLFKCSYCSYKCNREESLKAHMFTHPYTLPQNC
ncbi:UNVERIFIED_CONTAM: hypothetical protein RMT77_015015 [Armadillidium vulgare]